MSAQQPVFGSLDRTTTTTGRVLELKAQFAAAPAVLPRQTARVALAVHPSLIDGPMILQNRRKSFLIGLLQNRCPDMQLT